MRIKVGHLRQIIREVATQIHPKWYTSPPRRWASNAPSAEARVESAATAAIHDQLGKMKILPEDIDFMIDDYTFRAVTMPNIVRGNVELLDAALAVDSEAFNTLSADLSKASAEKRAYKGRSEKIKRGLADAVAALEAAKSEMLAPVLDAMPGNKYEGSAEGLVNMLGRLKGSYTGAQLLNAWNKMGEIVSEMMENPERNAEIAAMDRAMSAHVSSGGSLD